METKNTTDFLGKSIVSEMGQEKGIESFLALFFRKTPEEKVDDITFEMLCEHIKEKATKYDSTFFRKFLKKIHSVLIDAKKTDEATIVYHAYA